MKRDPALVSLSHDHHQALFVAQKLRRAGADTAGETRDAFLAYWHERGRAHFRLEEDVVLPAYAAHGDPYHPLVARALCDHVAIRGHADKLAQDSASTAAALNELGVSLADHVRLEERELFPLIERALPATALTALATALEEAEAQARDGFAGGHQGCPAPPRCD